MNLNLMLTIYFKADIFKCIATICFISLLLEFSLSTTSYADGPNILSCKQIINGETFEILLKKEKFVSTDHKIIKLDGGNIKKIDDRKTHKTDRPCLSNALPG